MREDDGRPPARPLPAEAVPDQPGAVEGAKAELVLVDARLLDEGLIAETETRPRNSRTYALTEAGLEKIRRWLTHTEPERRVRSDAALRTFFLWLLEPADARAQLEREQAYWQGLLEELRAVREDPRGTSRKEHALLLALEGGIRTAESRLGWLAWALEEVSSDAWREEDAAPESAPDVNTSALPASRSP